MDSEERPAIMNFQQQSACKVLFLLACLAGHAPSLGQSIPTPESRLGFALGSDGRLASWRAIADYYQELGRASDRVSVLELGESTLGNPFLLIVITAPDNHSRLERLAEISRGLADPRGLSDEETERLISEGRCVVAVTVGLHSTEVAATQMAPGLAYRLASSDDAP